MMLNRKCVMSLISHNRKFLMTSSRLLADPLSSTQDSRPLRPEIQEDFNKSKQELKWRVEPGQQSGAFKSKFKLFLDDEETPDGKVRESQYARFTQPWDMRPSQIKKNYETMKERAERATQVFNPERHEILGNDLATAHFVVFRRGQVKFLNGPWVKMKDEFDMDHLVPRFFDASFILEAVDCEGMLLYFEGCENLRKLKELKCLSFRGIKSFDDWCLDRVSGLEHEKLEVLDISGTGVTHRGLQALYRIPTLKKLFIENPDRDPDFTLTIAMLQEIMPELEIVDPAKFRKIPGFPLPENDEKK